MSRISVTVFSLLILLGSLSGFAEPEGPGNQAGAEAGWPDELSSVNRPWTRWWWMGNAVDKRSLSESLEEFQRKGLGGVEISPIYGVKGYEENNIIFLSPEWVQMLDHTISEAKRLGMGVDLIAGTGWPYGGPRVTVEEAASRLTIKKFMVSGPEKTRLSIGPDDSETNSGRLVYLLGTGPAEERLDLTGIVDSSGLLEWVPPEGEWLLYAAFSGKTGQKVKRAAPGGEGLVVDHFSKSAVIAYQSWFNEALGPDNRGLRSLFNDSYEAYGTNWTPGLFYHFQKQKNYDLRLYLKELSGDGDEQLISRVLCDYREVLSGLLLENFTEQMTSWAGSRNSLFRNQAHGSPGNILDLYGAADIPECETFGASVFDIPGSAPEPGLFIPADQDQFILRFAASAAHTLGKPLVSSESMTWLREHFTATLAQMKPEAENLFLAGINHLFFHGTAFTPSAAEWPGWKFYASVNLAPANSIWEHSEAFFEYITRCQSLLQAGKPDSDVLLYFPVHDLWSDIRSDNLALNLSIHNLDEWLHTMPMYRDMVVMTSRGWLYDLISDRQLSGVSFADGRLRTAGGSYRALVIPELKYLPVDTLETILGLADQGATVIFQGIPGEVPGMDENRERKTRMDQLLSSLDESGRSGGIKTWKTTRNKTASIFSGENLEALLEAAHIKRESLADSGLRFIRRRHPGGSTYYLVNHSGNTIEEYLELQAPARFFVFLDPQNGKLGSAEPEGGNNRGKIKIRLHPGQSLFLQALAEDPGKMESWKWPRENWKTVELEGPWKIRGLKGGPSIPENLESDQARPWTDFDVREWNDFSGTAEYSTEFNLDKLPDYGVILSADNIFSSGKVLVNGIPAGYLWSYPYQVDITPYLKQGANHLSVEVASTSANRIRFMDRQGLEWKKFEDINIVSVDYQPLDFSAWPTFKSGLGKIKLLVEQ